MKADVVCASGVELLMEYLEGGELIKKLNSQEEFVSRTILQIIEAV